MIYLSLLATPPRAAHILCTILFPTMGNGQTTDRSTEERTSPKEEERSSPNSAYARAAPTEYVDADQPRGFLAFTSDPCIVFSRDGCTRMVFSHKGELTVSRGRGVWSIVIDGVEVTLSQPSATITDTSLFGTRSTIEALYANPTADIIVDAAVAPHIPRSHRGDIFTMPEETHRVYKNEAGCIVGVDGLDYYRTGHV